MSKRFLLVFAFVLLACLCTAPLFGQTVLKRVVLGNQVESLTFVPTGPYANHIVFIDGGGFFAFPAEGRGNSQKQFLFDFSKLNMIAPPRGVAYIPEEKLFVFTDAQVGGATTTLHLTDHQGNPKANVIFDWPADWAASSPYVEGIVWVPTGEPRYPGCFIFSGIQTGGNYETALFVVKRNGDLVAKITINNDPYSYYVTGLAYFNGTLLAGQTDTSLMQLDLDGTILFFSYYPDVMDIEGIAPLRSGRIVLTGYGDGRLIYLDGNFHRLPEERNYRVGFGLTTSVNAAWDSGTSEFLVHGQFYDPSINLPQVAAINDALTSSRRAVDLLPYWNLGQVLVRLDYVPDAQQIMVAKRAPFPRGFYFFDQAGAEVDFAHTLNSVTPSAFAFIPSTQQIVLRSGQKPHLLQVYDRYATFGPPLRTIDVSFLGFVPGDVAYFNPAHPSGGELLLVGGGQFTVLDFDGNLLAQYPNTIGVNNAKPITSGPYAGGWVGTNTNTDEMFIFNLP